MSISKSVVLSAAVLGALSSALSSGAAAQTFREAVERARATEPGYLAAQAGAAAAQQRSKIAFGGLLPQISATAGTNSNRRDYDQRSLPPTTSIDNFNGNSAQINLTQPLYRPSNLIALRQAEAALVQSGFQVLAAEQELLARLVVAWFDAMSARDAMLYATRQVAATRQQADILKRGATLGTASAPALEEALARHEQARAERVAAEMDFHVKAASLEQIIGPAPAFVPPFLSHRASFEVVGNTSLEQWLEYSAASPQIQAAEQAVVAAEEEIRKQRAGHQPTVDLVTTYGRNAQQVGNFPGQAGYDILQGVIGLQLTVPLYSGGAQVARVDEAIAAREKVRYDLIATQRATRLAVKQAWYGWQAALTRRSAALQSASAALSALRAALVGIGAGVKTDLDRLQAQQQVENARRDFNKARYESTLYLVRLKAVAGLLTPEDVTRLDALFLREESDVHELVSMN
jgi:outer membrane protein